VGYVIVAIYALLLFGLGFGCGYAMGRDSR
jgi:hypothetical protein